MSDALAHLSLGVLIDVGAAIVFVVVGGVLAFRSAPARSSGRGLVPLVVVGLLATAHPVHAADRVALASIVAASVADAVTTERALQAAGAYEANPILHGSAVQREATKALTTAALVWGLARVGRRHARLATVLAWTAAGSLAALARHNAQIGGR